MEGDIEPGQGVRIPEDDPPRQRSLFPIAASGQKAADPAGREAQGDQGRNQVRQVPERQATAPDVPKSNDGRREKPAIEDQPPFPYFEYLKRILAKDVEVDQAIQHSRPEIS